MLENNTFTSQDGTIIYYDKYLANEEIASLIIIHGSVEHIARYKDFANYLKDNNISVYAMDLKGHGRSANGNLGFFNGLGNGFDLIKSDIDQLTKIIQKEKKSEDIFILGHSMGSFIVRDYLTKKNDLKGAIISGTMEINSFLASSSIALIKLRSVFGGLKTKSKFIHNIIYNRLTSKELKNKYLSHDMEIIEKYNNDPFCGYVVSLDYANEMTKCLKRLWNNYQLPSKNALLFISGKEDPIAGKDAVIVERVAKKYQMANPEITVELKLYEKMYHEVLNELNKSIVYQDTLCFINKMISR